ncbi:monocarboxylate permease-like protein, mch4 [Daldinia sp. FL1419]|nr:monocarboxylate permease-like protein, mch4 [Daldinia sp. FL1419]
MRDIAEVIVHEDDPPDGGLVAWLQVLGAFVLYFNHWGTMNTFGVYQTYYEKELLQHMSPSDISWIGSLQSFLLLGVGVVSGPLYDAGFLRLLLVCGSTLMTLGTMLTSICTEYWQVMLAQGVCVGVGAGCLFIPSVAVIPEYFQKRKSLAMGIGLLSRIGFGWTARIMGFTFFATTIIPLLVLRRRTITTKAQSLIDLKAPPLSYVAFFSPIFYLQSYALLHGTEGQGVELYLVAILNAASVLGRITPSFIANNIGPIHTLFLSAALTCITIFAWINTNSGGENITFAVFYGFFTGGMVALPAVTTGDYIGIQLFAGFVFMGTAILVTTLRFNVTRRKLIVKA